MKGFKGLLSFAAVIALSGCIEGSGPSHDQVSSDQTHSVIKEYARTMEQHALMAQAAFADEVQSHFAASEALPAISEIVVGGAGHLSEHLSSYYCVDPTDTNRAMLYTWLNTATSDGDFKVQGVGVDSGGAVLSALSGSVSASNIGLYNNGRIKYANASSAASLPAGCDLNIPHHSPVISYDVDVTPPAKVASTVKKYRTVQCPEGELGHIVQVSTVTRFVNGNEIQSAWTDDVTSCEEQANIEMIQASSSSMAAIDSASIIAAVGTDSEAGNILRDRLAKVECRNAKQIDASDETEGAVKVSEASNEQSQQFSTCGDGEAVSGLEDLTNKYDVIIDVQEDTVACSGAIGSYNTSYGGYEALVSHASWDGEETYRREIHRYILDNEHTDTMTDASEERIFRGAWEGVSIQCERSENLNIACDAARPENREYENTDDRGFSYNRINTINGWADPIAVVPNKPVDPAWVFDDTNSGCAWRQTQTINEGCPSGYTGSNTRTEERFMTLSSLNEVADWGEWAIHSSTNTCRKEQDENSPSNNYDTNGDGRPDTHRSGGDCDPSC